MDIYVAISRNLSNQERQEISFALEIRLSMRMHPFLLHQFIQPRQISVQMKLLQENRNKYFSHVLIECKHLDNRVATNSTKQLLCAMLKELSQGIVYNVSSDSEQAPQCRSLKHATTFWNDIYQQLQT